MKRPTRTLEEVRQAGIDAVAKALGPVDAVRFFQIFSNGSGDYTKERSAILGRPSVADLMEELRSKSNKSVRGKSAK